MRLFIAVDDEGAAGEQAQAQDERIVAHLHRVEQQMAAANAALDAALVEGATIMTADSQTLGTVGTVEGDNVLVVRAEDAGEFTVPRNYFVATEGQLIARLTMAQVDAALADMEANAEAAADM